MDWKDEFKKWLSDEGYTQWINYSAVDRLVSHIDTDLLIGLKAELHTKNMLLKEVALSLRNGGYDEDSELGKLYKKCQPYE